MTDRPDPTLIRLCCDGEATPEQAAKLRQYMDANPECCCDIQSQMECERKLRQSISKIMGECPCAPADLKQCICNMIDEAATTPAEIAGRIEPVAAQRARPTALRSLFSNTQNANWIAVAATLLLIAGAVMFGIFGRTIDDVRPSAPNSDLVADAAMYVDQEHRNLAGAAFANLNTKVDGDSLIDDAERSLSALLQTPVRVFDLSGVGYEFIGAEQCRIPVPAPSGHLIYKKIAAPGERAPMLSVFMVRDLGQCRGKLCEDQKNGTWCCLTDRIGSKCKKKILRGTDGTLVYFVVCCDDQAVESLAHSLQLPQASSR